MEAELTVPVIMVVGALATALTAVANQRSWSADKKRNVSALIAVALGLPAAVILGLVYPPAGVDGPWWQTGVAWITWVVGGVAGVITASQAVYTLFWQHVKKLEHATDGGYEPERAER